MSTQGAVGRAAAAPSSRRFPISVAVVLLVFLGIVSWKFVTSYPSLPLDVRDYDRLSIEHLGAVNQAQTFLQFGAEYRPRVFAWMACADDWLLHGSAEFGPGGLLTLPVNSTQQRKLVQDLSKLQTVETTLADIRVPESERSSLLAAFEQLVPQVQADEASLRAELGLAPLQDMGVAPHVLARCAAY